MLLMQTSGSSEVQVSTLPVVPAAHRMSIMRFLIERELGQDVQGWMHERRSKGKTWDEIAREMSAALRLPADMTQISRQLLQKWYRPVGPRPEPAPDAEDD